MPFVFKKVEKAVASLIIVVFFFLLALVILIGKGTKFFDFKDSYLTVFNESYGLSGGQAVKYKGMNIGKIQRVELTDGDQFKLTLKILRKYRRLVRRDSVLKVSSSLLGSSSLVLMPSLTTNSLRLQPGSMIFSADMTMGREILEQVEAGAPKKEDLMYKVNRILDGVVEMTPQLTATVRNVRDITADIRDLTHALKSPNHSIGSLIYDRKNLYGRIDHIMESIDNSLSNVQILSAKLTETPDDLKQVILLVNDDLIELKSVLSGVKKLVGGGSKNVEMTIKSGDRE